MDFKNKKITLMGLGLLGRGIGVAKFLIGKGAKVVITDLKTKEEIAPSVKEVESHYQKLKKAGQEVYLPEFILGEHRMEDFRNADIIFRTAGAPFDSPYLKEAEAHGISITMDDAFFAREAPCEIIGVTGTRGKTTVATLIYEIAKETGRRVFLSGVRGTVTLPLLDKVKKNDLVVLELSSWQLQGWRGEKVSPHFAVFMNIYEDHMNYYRDDMGRYISDKKAIFTNQKENDYLFLNKSCGQCKDFPKETKGKVIWFSKKDVPAGWKIKMCGEHNLENIAAAMAVSRLFGVGEAKIKKVVEKFNGVPGRLEFLKMAGGIKYYNDTTATMPTATIAALATMGGESKEKKIVLIAGGADKNLNFGGLALAIKKYVKSIVLLAGTATPKLQKELVAAKCSCPMILVNSMREAVYEAKKVAKRGDIVLLSPACASFGLFKNEFDRGEKFIKEIKKIR